MSASRQSLRIIGGAYRGRRLEFVQAEGLRPTADRVRETLFNWLQPIIQGASCLDLFAGSGLLGFEAASRGAAEVVFVEQNPRAASQIQSNIDLLKLDNCRVINAGALDALLDMQQPYDVVFIDPPFGSDLLLVACEELHARQLLKAGGRVYMESEKTIDAGQLPTGWQLSRSKKAGQVFYYLAATG